MLVALALAYVLADDHIGHKGYDKNYDGYFQYANVPGHHEYEFGYKRGNPHHYTSRYEQGKDWRFRTKVKWADSYDGYGEQYYEYNHGHHHEPEKGYHHEPAKGYHSEPAPTYAAAPPQVWIKFKVQPATLQRRSSSSSCRCLARKTFAGRTFQQLGWIQSFKD